MPYPEKIENLLSIRQAAQAWEVSPATIQTALRRGAFGNYARKIGDSWVIMPEGMIQREKRPGALKPEYSRGIPSTTGDFDGIETAINAYKGGRITADEAIKWIASIMKKLSE